MLPFSEILWEGDLNSSRYFFFVVVGVIMPLKTKVGNVWKDALATKVKVGSQWKPVTQLWSRHNGGWIAALGSGEIRFINTVARVGASIYQLMGSPTQPGNYVFENHAALTAGSGSFAVRTGIFPAGSTLTIVNKGYIRGKGGDGGSSTGGAGGAGGAGSTAIYLDMSCIVDNAEGFIFGGGGGGGGSYLYYGGTSYGRAGGGGGGGVNGGTGASSNNGGNGFVTINSTSTNGSTDSGGVGGYGTVITGAWARGGNGGAPGQPGTAGTGSKGSTNLSNSVGQGGPAGAAIARNGYVLTILSGNDTTRIKGPIS